MNLRFDEDPQNVSCRWFEDWFHGGLQFQIERHLWPSIPRHPGGAVMSRFLGRDVTCPMDTLGLPYRSAPLLICLRDLLLHLHAVTALLRREVVFEVVEAFAASRR